MSAAVELSCDNGKLVDSEETRYGTKCFNVATKIFCRDKHNFVMTRVLSWQKYACHDKSFCHDKNGTCGSSCQ